MNCFKFVLGYYCGFTVCNNDEAGELCRYFNLFLCSFVCTFISKVHRSSVALKYQGDREPKVKGIAWVASANWNEGLETCYITKEGIGNG